MALADWRRMIDEAAELGAPQVQFIGGEPTLHPGLPELIRYALGRNLRVEVFSNLVRVTPELWDVFSLPGVSLATSYYSANVAAHDAVTGGRSHDRTLAAIRTALKRSIQLRVGVIDVLQGQQPSSAVAELASLGVTHVTTDYTRQVGRGVRDGAPGVDQLCGQCANNRLAVTPSGTVYPCVFSRWLAVGNARESSLKALHHRAAGFRAALADAFEAGSGQSACKPPPPPPPPPPRPQPPSPDGGCGPAPCPPLFR